MEEGFQEVLGTIHAVDLLLIVVDFLSFLDVNAETGAFSSNVGDAGGRSDDVVLCPEFHLPHP